MIYKTGDKISYLSAPCGSPNGVVKSVFISRDKTSDKFIYGRQVCNIACGQFKYTVAASVLRPRIVEKIAQVYVSEEFTKLGTRKLLGLWRERRRMWAEDLYNIHDFYQKFDNDVDAFFNDIGFDDFADKKLAQQLMYQKYERDQHEIRYELSQRENVDHGLGAKIYRRKKAKKRHGQNKSKNR